MKVFDIAWKDLLRSFRSVFALGMTIGAPLLIAGLIYFAFGGMLQGTGRFDLPDLRVAVVNRDQPAGGGPALGAQLGTYLQDERMPGWLLVQELPDEAAARGALERQEIGAAVLIPADFSRTLSTPGGRAALTVLHDPTLTIGPRILRDLLNTYVDGVSGAAIALSVLDAQAQAHGVTLDAQAQGRFMQDYVAWFTAFQQESFHGDRPVLDVQVPGQAEPQNSTARLMGNVMAGMLVFFVFFTGALTAQSILREDEEGTLARLFITPTPRAVILGGKFAGVFATVALQALALFVISALLFGIQWGRIETLLLVAAGLVTVSAGLGVCVMAFLKSVRQSGPVLGGVYSMMGMLGGSMTTTLPMPAAFEIVNLCMPQGWALRALKLALDGADPSAVLVPALVMFALGGLFFAIGTLAFRRRFA
jgi:ABC-2 type transport system permease protein